MSKKKTYRRFTAQQKLELVVASWRGERSIAQICRDHDISQSLLRRWREQALEAAGERFAGAQECRAAQEDRRAGTGCGSQDL